MHEHAIHQAELDRNACFKPATSFVARKTKTRKPGRIDRAFSEREYEFSTKFGSVVEHRAGGFGLGSVDRAFFVRSTKRLTPPLETDLAIAVGTITKSNGRTKRPKLVLLGYASEKTGLVYTRGNWHMLFGRPILKWLFAMPLFAAGLVYCQDYADPSLHPFSDFAVFLFGFLLFLGVFWPFMKFWQSLHARYAFKAHVSQLYRAIGR